MGITAKPLPPKKDKKPAKGEPINPSVDTSGETGGSATKGGGTTKGGGATKGTMMTADAAKGEPHVPVVDSWFDGLVEVANEGFSGAQFVNADSSLLALAQSLMPNSEGGQAVASDDTASSDAVIANAASSDAVASEPVLSETAGGDVRLN